MRPYRRVCACVQSLHPSCPILCNPTDCSPPGSALQAQSVEFSRQKYRSWVAISYTIQVSRRRENTRMIQIQEETSQVEEKVL